MNTKPKQDQCNVYERRGQLVLALNCEKMIPENAPVRLVSAVLEELDYERLYRAYSPRGRKSAADPQVLFEVMVYGYLCGIYSSRKLEEACRYRVDFMWLLGDEKAPDHSTLARFRTGRCREALEGLFYQLVKRLEAMGELKAGMMETQFRPGFAELVRAICRVEGLAEPKTILQTWTRNMIRNDLETAQIATQSVGVISDQTILKNHPWVEDVEAEQKQLKKEQEQAAREQPQFQFPVAQNNQNGGDFDGGDGGE